MIALLFGTEVVVAALFYDLGLYSRMQAMDMGTGWGVYIISAGLLISLLMGYKGLAYRDVFNPKPVNAARIIRLLPGVLLACLSGIFIAGLVTDAIVRTFPPNASEIQMFRLMVDASPVSLAATVVIVPVMEEMIFRGVVLRSFLTNYSPGRAIGYSALLFAIYHLNIYQFPGAYFFGLLAGWIYFRTQSLWPSLLAHMVANAFAITLSGLYGSENALLTPDPLRTPMVIGGAMAALLIGLVWAFRIAREPEGL